jgi:hypothetical protein
MLQEVLSSLLTSVSSRIVVPAGKKKKRTGFENWKIS